MAVARFGPLFRLEGRQIPAICSHYPYHKEESNEFATEPNQPV